MNALTYAIFKKNTKIVELLVKYPGIDINGRLVLTLFYLSI